jgi:hypothetical protein
MMWNAKTMGTHLPFVATLEIHAINLEIDAHIMR